MSDIDASAPQSEQPALPCVAEPAAPPPEPPPDPHLLELRQAIADRSKPRALSTRTALFAGTLALFIFTFKDRTATELPMLIGVLLFHELGHYAAMRAYGYKNLQLLFIPFVGAAAMGRRTGAASQWQSGVILLAGPVPGLLIGLVLLAAHRAGVSEPLVRTLALQLIVINGLNLLPIVPLDGGRLLQGVLFSRHPVAEIGFSLAAAAALLAWSAKGEDRWAQWVAYLLVMGCFHRWRVLEAGRRLRDARKTWTADLHAVTDDELRELEAAAIPLSGKAMNDGPKLRAAFMEQLHEVVATPPATLGQGVALGGFWLGALALVAGGLFVARAPQWQSYQPEDGLFRIQLPAKATLKDVPVAGGYVSSVVAFAEGGGSYCLIRRLNFAEAIDVDHEDVPTMLATDTQTLLTGKSGKLLGTERFHGWPAQHFTVGQGAEQSDGVMFATPTAGFIIMGPSNGKPAEARQKCFDSFVLLK